MTNSYRTIRQAAHHLGLCTKSIYRLIERGDLEAVRLGPRMTRVSSESIERLLTARTLHAGWESDPASTDFTDALPRRRK